MAAGYPRCLAIALIMGLPTGLLAQTMTVEDPEADVTAAEAERPPSPWLLVPRLSSDPKVGTSIGFLAGYLFSLDEQSTSSMVGGMASYSDTDSVLGGIFTRMFWDNDSRRIIGFVGGGKIKNDYEDFQGTGLPVSTTDNAKAFYLKYLHEILSHWYLGVQGVYTNYMIVPNDHRLERLMELGGLTGVDSGALGLVVMYDTRDNQNAPSSGVRLSIDNFAYREAFGGKQNFDLLNVDFRQYLPHGDGHVLAYHASGRWTWDAPVAGYSSVSLRGYTLGQYLAPHSSSFEVEERLHIKGPFSINLFGGVACLYGNDKDCTDSENFFVSGGIGAQYVIKPSENMVVTVDYAKGEDDNSGFYLRFGQSF